MAPTSMEPGGVSIFERAPGSCEGYTQEVVLRDIRDVTDAAGATRGGDAANGSLKLLMVYWMMASTWITVVSLGGRRTFCGTCGWLPRVLGASCGGC